MLVILAAAVGIAGTHFSDSTRLPASDSSSAYGLLAQAGSNAASAKTGTIVWRTTQGSATTGATKTSMSRMLTKVSDVAGVQSIVSPFAAAGAQQVSKDGHTAYATVVFSSTKHADQAKAIALDASTRSVDVHAGGTEFTNQTPSETGELIGIVAALLVLLLVFRSVWAAALPIITGVCGVAVSSLAVLLLTHVMTFPSVALSLGALIGLGVGIDYALLVVNRHIRALRDGTDVPTSIALAMNTAGRSVLFAGGTVVVALLGMLILGFQFLSGMAVGASLTVLLTVAAAVTLLPAFLSKAGPRVLRRAERADYQPGRPLVLHGSKRVRRRLKVEQTGGIWGRWASVVKRRPAVASVAALAVLLLLASPVLSMRLGSSDASSDPSGTATRAFYDTMANAFGKGYNADLIVVAKTPDAQSRQAWRVLVSELPHAADVASVSPSTTIGSDDVRMVSVQPNTPSQARATSTLVTHLRNDLITSAEHGNQLQVHVGGTTATSIDFANALTSKLPLYLVIIAALGFVLLMAAFRSLLVPAIGALSNLLTIGVALGATVAVFQWGWGPSQFGIGGGPVEYIVAMLIIGVIFGLSMDYQVFLASRIREEYVRTGDNNRAITAGVSHTGRVIATAAAIMFCVFASFGFAGLRTASEFGVGLAVAVVADAFLVRMTIIPAIMRACGARNWAMPTWLDRALPNVSVEGPEDPGPDVEASARSDEAELVGAR